MKILSTPSSLEPFVKEVILLESNNLDSQKKFPFYADGFAGIVYSKSKHPFFIQPLNKELPDFYLYGQTVQPISLEVLGKFRLVTLRLFPFAVRILLGVDPKILVDDCYDLIKVKGVNTQDTIKKLHQTEDVNILLEKLVSYFNELLKTASINPDHRIKLATNLILKSKGIISIKEVRSKLHVAERTFERHFLKEIGVTPKQFAKIIQFSSSLNQITDDDYIRLTDVSFDNGFADQSHFIRTFKRFTGKTPKEFQKQISA
ncbi:MAG: helix-turn-helix domain-containing protein [Saprospiraceae bacterium]